MIISEYKSKSYEDYAIECHKMHTLSDIIITDYIVTDTSFRGHNYSRSIVSGKFFIFRTVIINFRLKGIVKA